MNRTTFLNSKILPQIITRNRFHSVSAPPPKTPSPKTMLMPKTLSPLIDAQIKRYVQSFGPNQRRPKTPDLIYMPHIIRWIKSKLRFKYLKKMWDPDFSEGAFIYGSMRAVCRITEIINASEPDKLDGLMTVSAKIRLEEEMKDKLTQQQKNLILLRPDDIKIFVPTDVSLIHDGVDKICKVALRVLALKWHEQSSDHFRLILVALQCEFTRVYGENGSGEWIISNFVVLECSMLNEATVTR